MEKSEIVTVVASLVGVVIGALISGISSYFGTQSSIESNERISEENRKLEWIKITQQYDFDRLALVLTPIRKIYISNDDFVEFLDENQQEYFGTGLYAENKVEIRKILKEHSNLVTYDMYKLFSDLEAEQHNMYNNEFHSGLALKIEDFSFDDNNEFRTFVDKEAEKIEEKYNL